MTELTDRSARCARCGNALASGSPLGDLCPRCLLMLAIEPQHDTDWTDAPGTRFGAYCLLEKLGEGGMGVVWRAQQEHPIRRIVAVKVIKPGGDSRQVLSRFESERQALALLNHPNIATVLDAGVTTDGRPYFAMEYVPGSSITSFADQRALPIPARLELFLQLCQGVEHAHQKGLVHRDLKPTNILVTDHDDRVVVKIIDFGVTKALGPHLSAETTETQIGVLLGTPEYMSPEQAGLTHAGVDTRTDIYSLGLVLYELLIGALPFDARELRRKAVFEMLRVIREEEPPRLTSRLASGTDAEIGEIGRHRLTEPRTLLRQLRGDLEWITSRALEKEPARRYPSVSELRADVRRHLSHEPVAAGPPDLRYRLGKLARKHRGIAIAASVAVAALVVGAVVSTVLWIGADRARRENRERLKTLHVTTGLQLATEGEDLKALPWLVRALQLEEGGPRAEELHRIRIRHVLDNTPVPIRLWHHADLIGAYLGPDRTTLATWDRNGTAKIWDTRRGETVGPPLAHAAPLVDVRVSGSTVVTADARGTIRVWDARTARDRFPPLTHDGGLQFVRVSLPANRVLSTDRQGGMRLWALDSGRLVAIVRQKQSLTFAEFLEGEENFAAGDFDGSLIIGDSRTGETLFAVPHTAGVVSVGRAGERRLFTATSEGILRLWRVPAATLEFESPLSMPNGLVDARAGPGSAAAFACGPQGGSIVSLGKTTPPQKLSEHVNCASVDVSADGVLVALAYSDGSVRTWRTNGRPFASGPIHTTGVLLTRFLGESRYLLSVDRAGVVVVWDLSAAAPQPTMTSPFSFTSVFSPDGRHLGLANGSGSLPHVGTASVIDAVSGEAVLPPLRHGGQVRSIAFSPDGRSTTTGSANGTLRFWDRTTGEPVSDEIALAGRLIHLLYSPDGERLLTLEAAQDSPIPASLWEARTGRRVASLPEAGAVYLAGFSPDGRYVQTVTHPAGRVQVWRASDGRPVSDPGWVRFDAAAFRSNTEVVMVGTQSIEVRGIDGRVIATHREGIGGARTVSVTPDGATFVVTTDAGTSHVFRFGDSLAPSFAPWRLPGAVSAEGLSSDGQWFVGVSAQGQVRVWSLQTGEPVTPLRTVSRAAFSASFSPRSDSFQVSGTGARRWELTADTRSTRVLEKLAHLFSGHEIAATDLVPLPVGRLIDLANDPELAATVTPSHSRRWRWMVASDYVARRDWSAALPYLSVLATEPGAIWEVHSAYGHALAELGRWTESAAAFSRALARRSDSTELMYYEAVARAAGGAADAIDTGCAAALQKSGATRNPDRAHWLAALCALANVPDAATRVRVRDLAQVAADIEPDLERFVSVHAMALLRANDPSRAAAVLESVMKRPVAGERAPETALVHALAQRELGRFKAATESAARFGSSPLRSAMPWHRHFEAETWRRELRGRR